MSAGHPALLDPRDGNSPNRRTRSGPDPTVRAALHFVPVEQVDSVLAEALELKTCDPLRDDALPPPESGSRSREVPTFRQ